MTVPIIMNKYAYSMRNLGKVPILRTGGGIITGGVIGALNGAVLGAGIGLVSGAGKTKEEFGDILRKNVAKGAIIGAGLGGAAGGIGGYKSGWPR